MSREFHVEPGDTGTWEVRDRAGVWVSDHSSKREAQAAAKAANREAGTP